MPLQVLTQVAIDKQLKQPGLIDNFLNNAPVLATVPFIASTHDLSNVSEQLVTVKGAGNVEIDGVLEQMYADTNLVPQALSAIGGTLAIGQDKALLMGGKDAYFAKRMPTILKATGETFEHSYLYTIARKAAIDAENVNRLSGTGSALNSIVITTYSDQNTGLYSKKMYGNGALSFDMGHLGGGDLVKIKDAKDREILGYEMWMKSYFGFQMHDTRGVSAIVNIDASNKPTILDIDNALDDANAQPGSTVISCSPKTYTNYIKPLLTSNGLRTQNGDGNVFKSFKLWDDIAIVTSRNFDWNGEAAVPAP